MNVARLLKWITGGMEAFLGIPLIGGTFILATGWAPLQFMFLIHLVTLVFCFVQKQNKAGSILGLITSLVGYVPVLGMIMHIITALVLLIDALLGNRRVNDHVVSTRR